MANSVQHMPTAQELADLKARELDAICVNESELVHPWWHNLKYAAWGILFGIVFVKAEIVSWFRIQEMFRFESFHMYGVIGTAVVVGLISVLLIKRTKAKTIYGEEIHIPNKEFNKGQIYGGLGHHRSLSGSFVRANGRRLRRHQHHLSERSGGHLGVWSVARQTPSLT